MKYNLVLKFDTDDKEFRRGFEAGRVYEGLKVGETEFMVQADNIEMMLRMAESCDMVATSKDVDDRWILVKFE